MAIDAKYGKITAENGDLPHGGVGVPLNESGDEPVFVIRAQDIASVDAIKDYFVTAEGHGSVFDQEQVAATVEGFAAWQTAHPDLVKVAD